MIDVARSPLFPGWLFNMPRPSSDTPPRDGQLLFKSGLRTLQSSLETMRINPQAFLTWKRVKQPLKHKSCCRDYTTIEIYFSTSEGITQSFHAFGRRKILNKYSKYLSNNNSKKLSLIKIKIKVSIYSFLAVKNIWQNAAWFHRCLVLCEWFKNVYHNILRTKINLYQSPYK